MKTYVIFKNGTAEIHDIELGAAFFVTRSRSITAKQHSIEVDQNLMSVFVEPGTSEDDFYKWARRSADEGVGMMMAPIPPRKW